MIGPLLKVNKLTTSIGIGNDKDKVNVVDDVSFTIEKGETFVLLGESGSGKSITALSIMRLLPSAANIVSGEVILNGQNLFELPESKMRDIRGAKIGMIFQEPQSSLNPVLTAGQQISETLFRHQKISKLECLKRSVELLDAVGIPEPDRRINEYPHQFSGGMKQRIMIALALCCEPDLLIADEPTTALDVTIQAQVLALLCQLQKDTGMAILFITHDLGVTSEMADHVAVMRAGKIVEAKDKESLFSKPEHPYTLQLFDAIPSWEKRQIESKVIKFQGTDEECLLRVNNLKIHYPIKKGLFKRVVGHVRAVDGVTLKLHAGETLALVGESGSGKTTMGKGILRLLQITSGEVLYQNINLSTLDAAALRQKRSEMQIVFQDPYSSMNPRMMIKDIIQEGIRLGIDYSQTVSCQGVNAGCWIND